MTEPDHTTQAEADQQFTEWMRENLESAARHFDATVTGEPVLGWCLRSISAPVQRKGDQLWLRVASEQIPYASGDGWTGNLDANAIDGIPKPDILDIVEWETPDWRRQRAELMTRMAGLPISPTDTLRTEVDLSGAWWDELRHSLHRLAAIPTTRINADQTTVTNRVDAAVGRDTELRVTKWETVHGDLQWANLLRPFALLDWEHWGRGPAGTDPATLYCYALLAPRTARTVWALFDDILDTDHGRAALLHVAGRLIRRATEMGDHPDLEPPLRRLAARLR